MAEGVYLGRVWSEVRERGAEGAVCEAVRRRVGGGVEGDEGGGAVAVPSVRISRRWLTSWWSGSYSSG